ncbi:glycogen operon protein [Andreprevotia lacus DSM 23236]|jgi:glycogen operon protein|uniref:Glycogen operon protein n=1 Tax=Andreprevotia lacus DSM 23236 TaxID=1121001 RepID=A0A1W1X793_9NEIS|nr:glycogen debranching protein GlgX [Andreprevotia lacus]SMC19839.1 glycogen operon protein [Andreprevotia lacus DSM 23236]
MKLETGTPYPLGATWDGDGINFALFSENATRVQLCLFDAHGGKEYRELELPECTDGVWHGYLPDGVPGLVYGYRVDGPYAPAQGHRFNPHKMLLDPYARAIVGAPIDHPDFNGDDLENPGKPDPLDSAALAPKGKVVSGRYDWGGDTPPATPWHKTVIYEAHVKGLTARHPDIPADIRGTYAALAHPALIAHLQRLGITALELLPVHAHADEPRLQRLGLVNYWGYNTLGFFAPDERYWSGHDHTTPLTEFRDAVKALHAAGIEVILDVVFNHSAELDASGPTLSFRGIDNASYYHLNEQGEYENWTGCGNTMNLAHPRMVQLVMDCLRYWVGECHVDGFRFDLGPVLGRMPQFSSYAPLFAAIVQEPLLNKTKFIAEPWDIGPGGYQLGHFPDRFAEWNDQYRDTMRRFWLHDGVTRGEFAKRFAASSDFFHKRSRKPYASVNFITAHDGFNLRDLVSYNNKHNEANGEQNRDGHNENQSWNCGVEGASDDPSVLLVRKRSKKALLTTLLLSQGTPMLLAGDELAHTQQGNNNAYCQDNDITHLDWASADGDLTDYISSVLAVRARIAALVEPNWWDGQIDDGENHPDVQWLNASGEALKAHDWEDSAGRAMMVQLSGEWLIVVNGSANQVPFRLPTGVWCLELSSTDDLPTCISNGEYRASARSVAVLLHHSTIPSDKIV